MSLSGDDIDRDSSKKPLLSRNSGPRKHHLAAGHVNLPAVYAINACQIRSARQCSCQCLLSTTAEGSPQGQDA